VENADTCGESVKTTSAGIVTTNNMKDSVRFDMAPIIFAEKIVTVTKVLLLYCKTASRRYIQITVVVNDRCHRCCYLFVGIKRRNSVMTPNLLVLRTNTRVEVVVFFMSQALEVQAL